MSVRPTRFGLVALALLACAALLARPHAVQRYALYLGTPESPQTAHLFLDPFPDRPSCESRVALFRSNGERAYCSGGTVLEIGGADDAVLAAEFSRWFPAGWYCSPWGRRAISRRLAAAAAPPATAPLR
jgi:hypothetical protein